MVRSAASRLVVSCFVGERVPVDAFESASSMTMGIVASSPATGEGGECSVERLERAELADVSRLSMEDRSSGCALRGSENISSAYLSRFRSYSIASSSSKRQRSRCSVAASRSMYALPPFSGCTAFSS
eukprot:5304252-Pleurochrysis_carterae.AAC.1